MGRKKLFENRADLILNAASRLFAEFGYDKTTLDEIALLAGVSKGSIYLEFESKEEILFAIILQNKASQLTRMKQIAARAKSPLENLKAMLVQNVGDVFDSVKQNFKSPEEIMGTRERARKRLKPFFEARLALIEGLLSQAALQNEICEQQDNHRLAQLLMLSLRGVLPPYDTTSRKIKLQNQAAELLELSFNGLKTGKQEI